MVSMNTVAEYVALERAEYDPNIERDELLRQANNIRRDTKTLCDLKFCAESLKHVRKIEGRGKNFSVTGTSTGIDVDDQTTWLINEIDLKKLMQKALAELETFPELIY